MHTAAQVVADAAEALTTAAQASLDEDHTQSRQTRPDSHAEAAKRSPHAKAVVCCTSQARTIYLTPPSDDSGLPFHEMAPHRRFAAKSPLHPASCTEWCDRHTFDAADTADTLRQASCSGATEMSSMQETPYYNGPATSPSSLANALGKFPNADFTRPISICCQWQGADDALRCCMLITEKNVPDHFNKVHKIKGGQKVKIQCCWGDCENTVVRHNFVRHIREAHLGTQLRSEDEESPVRTSSKAAFKLLLYTPAYKGSVTSRTHLSSPHVQPLRYPDKDQVRYLNSAQSLPTDLYSSLSLAIALGSETTSPDNTLGKVSDEAVSGYNNCPSRLCLWVDANELSPCFKLITCGDAPRHFKEHGIKAIPREADIACLWNDRGRIVKRHYFTRHIREVHLDHRRGVGHTVQN
ncbi:hypothetical protein SCLCIDRAFT_29961 [Scleroderma citrinum Foug A]|uniref:Uncharacterized protein n=1 Tax=Scleroderma citrinum Foug A TaxID=1036808 RepID=A0A0C3D518_9AGAM|nr:hypothetical protein SCLCIDRAFT_29961 [Scleroderma citrinum Foug A]